VRGDSYWGAWGGPLGRFGLDIALGRLALEVAVEGGYVVSPVGGLVAGVREVAVDGPWVGVQVGAGLFL
jgi:hypothetical protein